MKAAPTQEEMIQGWDIELQLAISNMQKFKKQAPNGKLKIPLRNQQAFLTFGIHAK